MNPFGIDDSMATDTQAKPVRPHPYRLTVRQYLGMIDAGLFPPNARVELLGGILVRQMTKGTPHNFVQIALAPALRAIVSADWLVLNEISLQLSPRSRLEPDLMITRGPIARFKNQDARSVETALVVEVADSTYAYDRGPKWRRYAAAKVPVYWIVNLGKRQVEVYRQPTGAGTSATYQSAEIYGEDAAMPVLIDGAEVGRVTVRDILP